MVPTDASGNWTHIPATPLAEGPHTVVVTATDGTGNTGTDASTFTVDTVAPAVAITKPTDGSTTDDTTPGITGTSDVVSGSIQLVIDGGSPVTVPTDATGNWTHTPATPLSGGPHTVVARATDAAGNTASDASTFTVVVAAEVTITSPEDDSTITDPTPDVTGTTNPGGTVVVSLDGGTGIPVRADRNGVWRQRPGALSCLQHTVTAGAGVGAATDSSTFTVVCAPSGAPSGGPAAGLPVTGSEPAALAGFGILFAVTGAMLLRTAQRRRLVA